VGAFEISDVAWVAEMLCALASVQHLDQREGIDGCWPPKASQRGLAGVPDVGTDPHADSPHLGRSNGQHPPTVSIGVLGNQPGDDDRRRDSGTNNAHTDG
jgi:hypothetical protein